MNIRAHAVQVLENLGHRQVEVRDDAGRWYDMRLLPYRTNDNIIDGVTIAFIDISKFERPLDQKGTRQYIEEGPP